MSPQEPMLTELSKIRFARFRFRLRAETPLRLPPYKGSTLRGGFGIAFKEAVCVVDHGDCERCLLRWKCAYAYVFETPIPPASQRMSHYEHAPHPFVIEPPLDERTDYAAGDHLELDLILTGRAIDYLPYCVLAFAHLGKKRGIGKGCGQPGGGRFSIEEVRVLNGNGDGKPVYNGRSEAMCGDFESHTIENLRTAPAVDSQLGVTFLTPARLVYERQFAEVPEFHILIRSLLRRLSSLTYFHGGDRCGDAELELDFHGLVEAAQRVKLAANRTRWHDWERYSTRQDAKLKMGGLVGNAIYEGDAAAFMPLLALGEVLHLGKGTVFGLGRYRLFN